MAVTQLLSIGYAQTILQNQIVALPQMLTRICCDDTTVTFQMSNDPAFGTSVPATVPANGIVIDNPFAFMRATNKNATIRLVRWQ
jgi:hypothetical protein